MDESRGEGLLRELFPDDVLARLERIKRPEPSKWDSGGAPVRRRHAIIQATRPKMSSSNWAVHQAWCRYLAAAEACGLLSDTELRGNLIADDDDGFRGAMAECAAVWLFSERLGGTIRPKPDPKSSKNCDFAVTIQNNEVYCEVKAPYVPLLNQFGSGDDAERLRTCISEAGSQFKKGRCNVVVLVPKLRTDVVSNRNQLVKAVIGVQAMSFFVSLDGSSVPPPQPTFVQNGKLATLHRKEDGRAITHFTRISAVVSLEEMLMQDDHGRVVVDHRVVVVHNPFAEVPLARDLLSSFPQLVKCEDGSMAWSDGGEDDETSGADFTSA